MKPKTLKIKIKPRSDAYDIAIGRGFLSGEQAFELPTDFTGNRVAVISNKKVFGLYGPHLLKRLNERGIEPLVHLIGDGERFKNFRTLESTLDVLAANKIGRSDAIFALGGGVVGDLAGFAAAVHLRGVSYVQIPTTLLAMIDSSVGGKTGINSAHGKNLVGAFYQPRFVLIDTDVLQTLPYRELTAGLCEAIKQGALAGPKLFDQTRRLVLAGAADQMRNEPDSAADLLAGQVRFKASIVAADERESVESLNPTSRKILNFGHTFAHALEKVTKYSVFKHGEAVGYGILFAAELSKKLDLTNNTVVESLNDVVHVGSSRVDLQACKLEYSIVSPK